MISRFSATAVTAPNANYHNNRMQAGALKVFEEAGGASDLFIPGVGEQYEDLAADFLENWLVSGAPSFEAAAESNESQSAAEPAPETEKAPAPEAKFTSFSLDLDWQISDAAKY